jgi:hypothetical protein
LPARFIEENEIRMQAAHSQIRPRFCSGLTRNPFVFFLDRERDDGSIIFGEFAFDLQRESLVAGDGAGEFAWMIRDFVDGRRSPAMLLWDSSLWLLELMGRFEPGDSGIHRAISIGHGHFRELRGGEGEWCHPYSKRGCRKAFCSSRRHPTFRPSRWYRFRYSERGVLAADMMPAALNVTMSYLTLHEGNRRAAARRMDKVE